jgi:hypothetical protein
MQSVADAGLLPNFLIVRFVIHYDVPDSLDAYVKFSQDVSLVNLYP